MQAFSKVKHNDGTKIIIHDRILEQLGHFNYLRNDVGYDRHHDIDVMLGKFQRICRTINGIFRNKVRRDTK